MIEQLMVRDYILFKYAVVDFTDGMTAITGETGAGKSLLIDAIGYVSGRRITSNVVRKGAKKAVIQMVISCEDPSLREYLEENGFEADEHLIIQRTITDNQKSTIRVNQQITTLAFVRSLTARCIDVHSQMDTYQLMRPDVQLNLLDQYCQTQELRRQVQAAYQRLRSVQDHLRQLENETLSDDELDYINTRYNEIVDAEIGEQEAEELDEKIRTITEAEKNSEQIRDALYRLEGEGNVSDQLFDAAKELEKSEITESEAEKLNDLYYDVQEMIEQLKEKMESFQNEAQDLNALQERRYLIRSLIRKNGGSYEAMMAQKEAYLQKIDAIIHRDDVLRKVKKELAQAEAEYKKLAGELSQKRQARFAELQTAVEHHCHDIMLEHARFAIRRTKKPASADGIDDLEFVVSMNPGQDFSPLKESASGGELSRLMLALKVVFQSESGVQTIIFDEIDTGVSGKVAFAMGQKMKQLSRSYQVLCITHLASVAAWADTHFKVEKSSSDRSTVTEVHRLDESESLEELAIMSSGKASAIGIKAARELKARVKNG